MNKLERLRELVETTSEGMFSSPATGTEIQAYEDNIAEIVNACPRLLDALEAAVAALRFCQCLNMHPQANIHAVNEKANSTLTKIESLLGERGKEEG